MVLIFVFSFSTKFTLFDIIVQQNMRIIKLQGDFEITKVELETTKHDLRREVIKRETCMIYGFGVAFFVMLVFDLTRLS
ncbi:unnamed protein product [Urochloa humidicola]